jgi:site-specific recombinase XerD
VTAAARTERDRLLLRVLWATGGRVSEVLALGAADVRRDALVLPNLKNPSRPVKTVFLQFQGFQLLHVQVSHAVHQA